MTQESVILNADPIASFCQNFISRHPVPQSINEQILANEFVLYFRSVDFLTISDLERFCAATGIELNKKILPKCLLATNCFPNGKRIIELDTRPQNVLIQPHSVLHEIRELLEYSFCILNYPIMQPDQIEMRANEFASQVMMCGGARMIAEFCENAFEIQSGLLKVGALSLIGIFAISVCLHAHFSAIYPQIQDQQARNQRQQRYLT
jgi:hypothetical protein